MAPTGELEDRAQNGTPGRVTAADAAQGGEPRDLDVGRSGSNPSPSALSVCYPHVPDGRRCKLCGAALPIF